MSVWEQVAVGYALLAGPVALVVGLALGRAAGRSEDAGAVPVRPGAGRGEVPRE